VEDVISLIEWFRRFGIPEHLREPNTWMQHELNTLSTLDYEMIRHVPIGGNWQHIPESVPSDRLRQIREMSKSRGIVRTTYYGRLRPDQPAYTIATYYNRPGNGTNIHPYEDRTLSHREAARLQSFPDSYSFIGGDGAIRKQIGNAVPPMLGRAVAQQLMSKGLRDGSVVDLFSGAGGLSLGFEMAGLPIAVAADNNEAALRTYAFNRPTETIADPGSSRTLLTVADLSKPEVREEVYASIHQKLNGAAPSAVIGGPPCQGFSYAGFRDPEDPRSDLAVAFLDFVEALRPEAVVLENVEGLLTARGGKVADELLSTLTELGYPVDSPWVLAAEQFGVPQMRRRVFLVALRGQSVPAPVGTFDRCMGRREKPHLERGERYPVTVSEALGDLPPLTNTRSAGEPYARMAFADWARGRLDSGEFLRTHARHEHAS
jgi:DNA (cytosine-5)-methyltransferase 1